MKIVDVQIGGIYFTRIAGELARVIVVRETKRRERTAFAVTRCDVDGRCDDRTERELPKPRSAAALRVSRG